MTAETAVRKVPAVQSGDPLKTFRCNSAVMLEELQGDGGRGVLNLAPMMLSTQVLSIRLMEMYIFQKMYNSSLDRVDIPSLAKTGEKVTRFIELLHS